ncbi:MAG: YciI family protein [Ectothiorhodospiraceae bacterium]|nr:YciI family protein [Paracoccaceae bacterium]MCH8506811.1 YciI family protein [Ectothiorhodospiraceae bacterium]
MGWSPAMAGKQWPFPGDITEADMKYLCLIYSDEKRMNTMDPDELQALGDECEVYCQQLMDSGVCLAVQALESVSTATTVRIRNGKMTLTDGPFAETKEQLGGFYLIEASDLNEALRIASGIPPARIGSVEVRPLLDS